MKKNTSKTWNEWHGAYPVTEAELLTLGVPQAAIDQGQMHGELKTFGTWQIPVSFRAIAVTWAPGGKKEGLTVHGIRTLHKPRESGYQLEGQLSLGGRTVRGFTSSELFQLPDGRYFNAATIHACI